MRKMVFAQLMILLLLTMVTAQNKGDACHVYIVDVAKTQKAFESFLENGKADVDNKALSAGQTLFPEFRTVIGEEELTNKTYQFPGSKLVITASVFYTDESMASSEGADSMLLGIVVSPKAQKDALSVENNAVSEITLNGSDTVRAKKYVKVNNLLYLVGVECHRKERNKLKS